MVVWVTEDITAADGAGVIRHHDGTVLGEHDGYFRFTVGQRKGLGVGYGKPLYVLGVDPETREVHVTDEPERLAHSGLWASGT